MANIINNNLFIPFQFGYVFGVALCYDSDTGPTTDLKNDDLLCRITAAKIQAKQSEVNGNTTPSVIIKKSITKNMLCTKSHESK